MNPDPGRPWMTYQDVVDDLVRPPLDEVLELVEKSLADSAELMRNLRSEQRTTAEQIAGLRRDHQALVADLSRWRDDQQVDILRSAVEAQYVLTRELHDAVEALRREQAGVAQRSAALEERLADHRPTWILTALSSATLILVIAAVVARLL